MNKTIDELVNRFLRWKLPKDFNPDGGISFKRIPDFPELNKWEYEPVGTNLFSAEQAKEMFEYCLKEEPVVLNNMSNMPEQVAKYTRQNSPDISKELAEHFKPLPKIDPVGYLRFISNTNVKFIHNIVLKGASPIITPYPDIPVYLAPQAELFGKVEQLELEKVYLIDYAKILLEHHTRICKGLGSNFDAQMESEIALAIPQPKFLES